MIDNRRVLIAAALAGLALGGCGGDKAAEGNKATGEVLEGTISDAMIATDLVRSEPPVAPRRESPRDPKNEPKAKTANADDDAPAEAPDAQAAPPAEPSPAPPPVAGEPPA